MTTPTNPSNGADMTTHRMKVFRLEDGAVYWIAAPTLRTALNAWFDCVEPDGAPGGGLDIQEMPEAKARAVTIHSDEETEKSAWELAQAACAPTVIGCSEWT